MFGSDGSDSVRLKMGLSISGNGAVSGVGQSAKIVITKNGESFKVSFSLKMDLAEHRTRDLLVHFLSPFH
jgi:hypothetical protein